MTTHRNRRILGRSAIWAYPFLRLEDIARPPSSSQTWAAVKISSRPARNLPRRSKQGSSGETTNAENPVGGGRKDGDPNGDFDGADGACHTRHVKRSAGPPTPDSKLVSSKRILELFFFLPFTIPHLQIFNCARKRRRNAHRRRDSRQVLRVYGAPAKMPRWAPEPRAA